MSAQDNPMGTDGFEFIEYTALDTAALESLFSALGFIATAHHRSKDVTLYCQGDVNFIVNREPHSFAQAFAQVHGPSVCAFGIRVKDAAYAFDRAIKLGANPLQARVGPMELNIPAIRGIGNSLIYLIDRYQQPSIYDMDFVPIDTSDRVKETGLLQVDHITHNVHIGRMNEWAQFYERLFNFKEIRYFDIQGKVSGLKSRAMVSPCGKIRIPINEPSDDKSQIQEYLQAYNGEGIQHIALSSDDIYRSVERLRKNSVPFMVTPDAYYENINERMPGHREDVALLREANILIDGHPQRGGLLLQIFTDTVIGPIFFEIIQRKGNQGFGEGNFQALFEAIERDQMKRGVI